MPDVKLEPVHDTGTEAPAPGIALCLSGGGYRAMMFHAGSLWRLNDAGLLGKLDRISSVSGGSIAAAVLGMNWRALNPQPDRPSTGFRDLVIEPLRAMAGATVDEGAILGGLFLTGSISDHVAGRYDELLFHGRTLQDLPDQPRFVINATNVQSGVLMRFSKPYIRDYRVGRILNPKFPLARAVAASSAFPPVLSPCEIELEDFGLEFEPADSGEDLHVPPYTTRLVLSDGGVYDNLGLETAWKRYDTILVSDGGGHYKPDPAPAHDWARHSYRVLDLVDSQVRALRTRSLIAMFAQKQRKGCYWGIRQDAGVYAPVAGLPCECKRTTALAQTPTRLKKMESVLQDRLINWGYAVCDVSLRRYYDPSLDAPAAFPYPDSAV